MFIFKLSLGLSIILIGVIFLPRIITLLYARGRIIPGSSLTGENKVAIVFGAGLWGDGSPSPVLRDRVATAANLYFAGKIAKLLMSGDNSFPGYNEPAAMQAYALELGIPQDAIILDFAGRRTYDTCYRAKNVFGIQQAVLVTQGFHLPRAIYTCNLLGMRVIGVAANLRQYHRYVQLYWNLRELPATLVAMWQLHISHPLPVSGDTQPIDRLEAQ
jgi:SanA protein